MADRLRYGRIKFTYDAEYTAAKRKTAEDRQQSRNGFIQTKKTVELDEDERPTEGHAFSLSTNYINLTETLVTDELYSEELGLIEITDDVLPEINGVLDENAPKELFPVINDLVMTILRAMLMVYIMTIPCAAAAADVVRPAPTSN